MPETVLFAKAGDRFTEAFDPQLAEFSYPYGNDEEVRATALGIHEYDKAHTVMLAEQSLISSNDAAKILSTLLEMERGDVIEERVASGQGFYAGEAYLTRQLGENIGGRIHTARSSSCMSSSATRIALRERVLGLCDELDALCEVLARRAEQHIEAVMPGFSHGFRHTVPLTFGHYLMSWVFLLQRHQQRLIDLYDRINISVAGTLAAAGSEVAIDQRRVADLLGFAGIYENNRDPVRNWDTYLEAFSVIAMVQSDVCRIGEDLDLWSSYEFRMVDIADRFCVTSSLLAQKKNPWVLEAIRGKTGLVVGYLTAAFANVRAASDHAEQQYSLSWQLWPATDTCRRSVSLMADVIDSLEVDEARMVELASADWTQASDMISELVRLTGQSFRSMHRLVARLVRYCKDNGLVITEVTPEMVAHISEGITETPVLLTQVQLQALANPRNGVARRSLEGGTSPDAVRRQLEQGDAARSRLRDAVSGRREHLRIADAHRAEVVAQMARAGA
jgi:argininosuccinate lyase